MKKIFRLTGMLLILVLANHEIQADPNPVIEGITLFGGISSASLKKVNKVTIYDEEAMVVSESEIGDVLSFGIGLIHRSHWGLSGRLSYSYQREADINYTRFSSGGFEDKQSDAETPGLPYTIHNISLGIMQYIQLIPGTLGIYIGGGGAMIVKEYSKSPVEEKFTMGGSLFPLGGVEMFISSKLSLFGEYQHHFGRSLHQGSYDSDKGYLVENEYYYEWSGPLIISGINVYFCK